jgi:hypothetical protein
MMGVVSDTDLQNIHAQAHARAILNQLETPPAQCRAGGQGWGSNLSS